jgi:hypothetical protein
MKPGVSARWKNKDDVFTNIALRRVFGPKGEEGG